MKMKHRRRHRNDPARKSHKRARRHMRRYHRNDPGYWQDLIAAVIGGGLGHVAAKGAEKIASPYMPKMGGEVLSAGLVGAAIVFAAEYVPVGRSTKLAIQAGAAVPLIAAIVNAGGLGQMLGTQTVLMLPAPPQSMGAELAAELAAEEDMYRAEY